MKPKDIVELMVRLVGLLFLYQALAAMPVAIANFCPIFPHLNFRSLFPSLILVGWPSVVGWYLFRGAPGIMRRAYPETPPAPAPTVNPITQR